MAVCTLAETVTLRLAVIVGAGCENVALCTEAETVTFRIAVTVGEGCENVADCTLEAIVGCR